MKKMKLKSLILAIPLLLACNQAENSSLSSVENRKDSVKTQKQPVIEYRDISKNHLLGKIKPEKDSAFTEIDVPVANRAGLYLRKEALDSFKRMREAAAEEGIDLRIISAFRSFNYQKWIWDSKFDGRRKSGGKNMLNTYPDPKNRVDAILNYSAMPGTSRHHWGTDIDINSVNTSYFLTGKGKEVYNWLRENAEEFGYCQVYTADREDGYNEEHWHWSYLPLANDYMHNFSEKVTYEDIKGFSGSEYARELEVISRYVLGNINADCMINLRQN